MVDARRPEAQVARPLVQDQALVDGLILRELRVDEVGALARLVIEIHAETLARMLQGALSNARLALVFEGDRLLLELEGPSGGLLVEVLLGKGPNEVRFVFGTRYVFGSGMPSVVALMDSLAVAADRLLLPTGTRVERLGPTGLGLEVARAVCAGLNLTVSGLEDAAVRAVEFTGAGFLRVEVGGPEALDPLRLSQQEARDEAVHWALVRDRVLAAPGDWEAQRARLDLALGPEALLEHLLWTGTSEAWSTLIEARLAREPNDLTALLAKANREKSATDFERVSRSLREKGWRRAAGLAARMAANLAKGRDRARLLEETVALCPDDTGALAALVEALPAEGRAAAAVRAARRWAHLANSVAERIKALVAAAELLEGPLKDPAQAQRELDKALKLDPEDSAVLACQARLWAQSGRLQEARQLGERLVARLEIEAPQEAVRLNTWLGGLGGAGLEHWERARRLAPDSLATQRSYLRAALDAGRDDLALEAVEGLLPALEQAKELDLALELRLLAATLFEDAERWAEAIEQLEQARGLPGAGMAPLPGLARLYGRTKDHPKRASILGAHAVLAAQAGALDQAADLWTQQAWIWADAPDALDEVRLAISAALARSPGHRPLLDALIEVTGLAGDHARQVEAIDRRLLQEDSPRARADLLTRLGQALERLERPLEAVRAYENALASDSEQAQAARSLVRLLRARGDKERLASTLARTVGVLDPEERAGFEAERARLLAEIGRDAEALVALEAALVRPDHGLWSLGTKLALRLGRLDDAERFLGLRLEGADREQALAARIDQVRLAELRGEIEQLISALEAALAVAEPTDEVAAPLAARLAAELYGAERLDELAELERKRGRIALLSSNDRAERFIEAARISARLGDATQCEADVEEALGLLGGSRTDIATKLAALGILEELARRTADQALLGRTLQRRSGVVGDLAERERLVLSAAEAHAQSGDPSRAVQALEEALEFLPTSISVAIELERRADGVGRSEVAAKAAAHAARLALERQAQGQALVLFGRAAELYHRLGDRPRALENDRALLALADVDEKAGPVRAALGRLEHQARLESDHALLVEILGRRARTAAPREAAQLLLERARVEAEELSREREALDTLRQARAVAPEGSEVARAADEQLVAALERFGLFAEQAAVLVDRAEKLRDPGEKAELLVRAARVYGEALDDRGLALSRVQAAVRADPHSDAARALRISLLRESGRREALAEALAEEAALSRDAGQASELWLEAARLAAPATEIKSARELEQALDYVKRAATAAPKAAEPLRVAAAYARILGRAEDEAPILAQLVEREIGNPERVAALLRRMDLQLRLLADPVGAQACLNAAFFLINGLDLEARAEACQRLPPDTRTSLGIVDATNLELAVAEAGERLTHTNADWGLHVRLLRWRLASTSNLEAKAELHLRAGEVMETRLEDPLGAEREYRAALALAPLHQGARERLELLFALAGRWDELADTFGADLLLATWRGLGEASASEKVAVARSLWPRLAPGEDRAQVMLGLADLWSVDELNLDAAVALLEQVAEEGPVALQGAALERLRVLFLEAQRTDRYVDVLRRQADRQEDDRARALAYAELGEALEWRVGDGAAAEREYRSALAIDPHCGEARQRLAELLAGQDRFADLVRDLGPETLERVVNGLVAQGERDRERAFAAAEALAESWPKEARAGVWCRFAERLEGSEDAVRAWQRAADEDGPGGAAALDRLIAIWEDGGVTSNLINVVRRRLDLPTEPARRVSLHLLLARLVLAERPQEGPGRGAFGEEAERELRAVLALDPEQRQAQQQLAAIYLEDQRYLELGRVLGRHRLTELRQQAEHAGERGLARHFLEAEAELADGPDRAALLVELVGYADADGPRLASTPGNIEGLYRAALAADPGAFAARDGLEALLEAEGRYLELAQTLGLDALRNLILRLRGQGSPGLLPALLGLASALETEAGTEKERAAVWVQAAELHLVDDDREAAEYALREAVRLDSRAEVAREHLRQLLVQEGRFEDLDVAMLRLTAVEAEASGDAAQELPVRLALASRLKEWAEAEQWVRVGVLHQKLGSATEAEAAYQAALAADPNHPPAVAALTQVWWSAGRYRELLQALGPETFLRTVQGASVPEALQALVETSASLSEVDRATALELEASLRIPYDSPERIAALDAAQTLWEQLQRPEGARRVGLVRVALEEARGDVAALSAALTRVLPYLEPEEQVARRFQLGALLTPQAALVALVPLLEQATEPLRSKIARHLLTLSPEAPAERAGWEVLVLTSNSEAELAHGWSRLAELREAAGEDTILVAEAWEGALRYLGREQATGARRRLVHYYEESGDWVRAAQHAAVLAELERDPASWVALSELRVWLDDQSGAEDALQRALELDPASAQAHESMVRLAERSDVPELLASRLEAWAEADTGGDPDARAERLLRAARLSATDSERSALLAERAVTLLPRGHARLESVAREALALLDPLGAKAVMVAILTRVVGEQPRGNATFRLRLTDLLWSLGRTVEAATVLEQGLHRESGADDPILLRFLADMAALPAEEASRRLLSVADRLGAGPVARRLRAIGAERAEEAGDLLGARTAWSHVVSEVAAADRGREARKALVRIARELDDPAALLASLLEALEDARAPQERAELLVEASAVADRLEDPERAESLLAQASRELPGDPTVEAQRLEWLRSRGRWLDLSEALTIAAQRAVGENRATLLEENASLLLQQLRDPAGAGRLYAQVFDERGESEAALLGAKALLSADLAAEAVSLLERALEAEVVSAVRAELWRWLAKAQERADQPNAALAIYAKLMAGPHSALAAAEQEDFLMRHGRQATLAQVLVDRATESEPYEALRLRLAAARIYERLKDPAAGQVLAQALQAALDWLSQPGATLPELPPGQDALLDAPLFEAAALAARLGQGDLRVEALRLFAQALPAGPEQWRVLLGLAAAEREAGDLDAAEFTLRGVVDAVRAPGEASDWDRVEAQRALGTLLAHRGRHAEAAQALEQAAGWLSGLGDGLPVARLRLELAEALTRAGRPAEALENLLATKNVAPELVSAEVLEVAIESAGPSVALAHLYERRAGEEVDPARRGQLYLAAAQVWEELDDRARQIADRVRAHAAEPGSLADPAAFSDQLADDERWSALESFLLQRLQVEALTDEERVTLLLGRAQILARWLGREEEALALLLRARDLAPTSRVVLAALAEHAALARRPDVEADALARWITVATHSEERRRGLLRRAVVLERLGDPGAATCLEEVLELELERGQVSRAVVERLAALERARGAFDSEARVWVRAATVSRGPEAAALLSRVAAIRFERLGDRRGAVAALEAALGQVPTDLACRRAAFELAKVQGDLHKALDHAKMAVAVAEQEGRKEAQIAYLLEWVRLLGAAGDRDAELEIWTQLLTLAPDVPLILEGLVARGREALDTESVTSMMQALIDPLPPGPIRGRLRLTRARLLAEPLGRHWEAEGERERVVSEDLPDLDELEGPDFGLSGIHASAEGRQRQRLTRTMLDRSGRWQELADLEEQRVAELTNPLERADAYVELGRLLRESKQEDRRERARDAFTQAVLIDPYRIDALAHLLRIDPDPARAADWLERLDRLGGAAWPAPELALAGAGLALQRGASLRAFELLAEGLSRDPRSLEVRRGLVAAARSLPGPSASKVELHHLKELNRLLDPVLDARELADLAVRAAELHLAAGQRKAAQAELERARALEPEHPRARLLVLQLLEGEDEPALLLPALEAAALVAAPEPQSGLLIRALDTALAAGDHLAAERIGVLLEPFAEAAPARDALIRKLERFPSAASVLRLAELVSELPPLTSETEALLFEARIGHGDWRALDRLAAQPEALDALLSRWSQDPLARGRVEAWLQQVPLSAWSGPSGQTVLNALCRRSGAVLAQVTRAQVWVHLSSNQKAIDAYRALLARDPAHPEWLDALLGLLDGEARQVVAEARALVAGVTRLAPVTQTSNFEAIDALLRTAAPALAAVLPVAERPEDLSLASLDPRLADLVAETQRLVDVPSQVYRDPDGGGTVSFEPGDPPALVLGEFLAAESPPAALRFLLARSFSLLASGVVWFEREASGRRQLWALLWGAIDSEQAATLDPELAEAAAILRARLGPNLATLSELVQKVDAEPDLAGAYQRAAERADQDGLVLSGNLTVALRTRFALEPGARGLSFDDPEVRQEALRLPALRNLLAWALSQEYLDRRAALVHLEDRF